ncbi:winged helix-turn-helix domain-containing protein [Amphiplicatus metriothermophilus]|uniref:Transcriptional regulator n=1 Tax=Amphiplicatus metriothermophilus TaxID=1519374 RepID=A0A239PV23_9PROT|nr:transcriptional regulator [Amphiplicatus metriothermophilus]MBB5519587.1 DNA-binding HxlR family transcriptional regulator [Amphiplicatus metriothermophilus]SNT74151.1 transcriptional regulator [Amphiplicatus metriothermophilus]
MSAPGPFDYREIDDVVHGRVRLALMAYLSGAGAAEFSEIKAKIGGASDGNLSVHIRKLEEAGYVRVEKRFRGRRPQTLCHLTEKGREAWIAYIRRMETLLRPRAGK